MFRNEPIQFIRRMSLLVALGLLFVSQTSQARRCTQVFFNTQKATHFISVLGGRFHLGMDRKPRKNAKNKIIYLDGIGLSFRHSQKMAHELRALGGNLTRLDMIGYSNTLKHSIDEAQGAYKVEDLPIELQAEAVIEAIEVLSNNKVILVGESYGGAVAALVAEKRPDLVERLMLVSPMVQDLSRTNPFVGRWSALGQVMSMNPWVGGQLNKKRRDLLYERFEKWLPWPLREFKDIFLATIYELSEGARHFDLIPVLSRVHSPTDFLFGSDDMAIDRRFFSQSINSIPIDYRGRLVELEGGEHDLTLFSPEFVARWIFEGIGN